MRIYQNELLFINNMYNLNWKNTNLLDGLIVYDDVLNKYYAYGSRDADFAVRNYLRISDDGINWEDYGSLSGDLFRTSINGMTAGYYNSARRFVAIGTGYGTTTTGLYVSTSSDFITWTTPTKNSNLSRADDCYGVAYGNNIFIALVSSNQISTSSNGTSWTVPAQFITGDYDYDANDITFFDNKFWITRGSGKVYSSTNGTTWELITTIINPNNSVDWTSITSFNGIYLAVGDTVVSNSRQTVYSLSFDLANWITPIINNNLSFYLLKSNNKIINYSYGIKRYVQYFTPLYLTF